MMGRRESGKRQRLIEAAAALFHRRGMHLTTIADIARDAAVPLGNVYYYFRTKDEIARAVLDYWDQRIGDTLGMLKPDAPPRERLAAYLDASAGRAEIYAALGCPLVALALDLRQSGRALAPLALQVHRRQIDWIGRQFRALGQECAAARSRAEVMLATLQGSFQLAHALGDPQVVDGTIASIKSGLDLPTHDR